MEEKSKEIRKISILGIIFNLILLFLKVVFGITFKSQGMLADGFNSAGDIFASLMSYIGNKISSKPKDLDHPYGHGKAEYIFTIVIAFSMIIAAITMIKNSILSIIEKSKLDFSIILIVVCLITIATKLFLYIYTSLKYRKNNSILIRASMEDHRNDMIVTCGTLIGIVCSYFGLYFVDGVVGIIISLWIFIVGIRLLKSGYDVLMDKNLEVEEQEKILKLVSEFKEIMHVDNISAKPVGGKYILILKVSMDGNLTLFKSHAIAGKLKNAIISKFDYIYDVVVHTNPH